MWICIPCLRQRTLKMIPWLSERPYIGSIWEYPPPPPPREQAIIHMNACPSFILLCVSRYNGHGFKLAAALNGIKSTDMTILLAHQPHAAKQALSLFPNIDLVLSGHTHGGQFYPLSIPVYVGNPFFAGLYNYNGSYVYVSSGTFYYSVPLRLGSTAEITILTLVVS